MVLLLLLFLGTTTAHDLSCAAHFPLKESVDILKKLVEIYAIPSRRTDASGAEWLNYLIMKNNGLETENTRYYFNDDRLPTESTFNFTDSLLLHPVPIFVVESKDVKNWQPDRPDRTKALKKISHKCDTGQRACGLKCCYGEVDTVQKGFLELGNLSLSSTYTSNDITYSIQQSDNSSASKCTYYLSYYDALFRKRMIGGKQVSAIHFSCPERFSCCGLRCVPPPSTALLRRIREANCEFNVVVSIQQRTFEYSADGGSSLFTDRFRLHHLHHSPKRHRFGASKRPQNRQDHTENGRHTNIDLFAPRRYREPSLHSPQCLDLQNSKFNTVLCSFGSSNHI